jgi:hypothetical protein
VACARTAVWVALQYRAIRSCHLQPLVVKPKERIQRGVLHPMQRCKVRVFNRSVVPSALRRRAQPAQHRPVLLLLLHQQRNAPGLQLFVRWFRACLGKRSSFIQGQCQKQGRFPYRRHFYQALKRGDTDLAEGVWCGHHRPALYTNSRRLVY